MFKITQVVVRYSKSTPSVQGFLRLNNFASAPITAAVRSTDNDSVNETAEPKSNPTQDTTAAHKPVKPPKGYNSLVAAAFASLKNEKPTNNISTPFTDDRINKAETVAELLSISEGSGVSRRHALKVVSVLAEWSTSGKVQLAEFESDPRFIRLCKILTKGSSTLKRTPALRSEDLTTILNVTADDEAARLITSISLPQTVKVMSTLAVKKRRSTPLLRSLAYNIAGNSDQLDLKQSADLLYSCAVLNFMDENLLEKVCSDVCAAVQDNVKGSAVIGSILTSLGLLRYKETGILDALSEWVVQNHSMCRPQDIFSLFVTLAILNHHPANSEQVYNILIPQLKTAETSKPTLWLDVVWSLVVLNQSKSEHIASVLSEDFIKKLEADEKLNMASKLKLLNIDSACNILLRNYQGPRLPPDSCVKKVIASRSKDKEVMVGAVQDSLSSLFSSKTHMRANVDTGMGFYIDAEIALDGKCNPLPLSKVAATSDAIKIAVLTCDYHDACRGRVEPTGINVLFKYLLEAQGYRTLSVLYTEFNAKDKLVSRVQYLERKLKGLVRS